ncbi:MAG: hypothetical protein K0R85_291 [Devosia sp.]|jgi:predicted component of type VI protein secretion system|nr:hypothetical protein [Devosia sp.]
MENNLTEFELNLLSDLAVDLATELDLHYEDDAAGVLVSSVRAIEGAVRILKDHQKQVPDACTHTLTRFGGAGIA